MESQLPDVRRVEQEWYNPILVRWAESVCHEIDASRSPVWLVAHSFGCLAAVTAASDRASKVAGAMLVAPANPERFSLGGVRNAVNSPAHSNLSEFIPDKKLPFPTLVVASADDPWISCEKAHSWAMVWGSQFLALGKAGHINVESGYGPWPEGVQLLQAFQQHHPAPLDSVCPEKPFSRGFPVARQGYISRVRHATRRFFASYA
jgi:predicted alpha/beta hydrolase family esterase